MSLFRIDKSTVAYQSTAKPFLVPHANIGLPQMPIFPVEEAEADDPPIAESVSVDEAEVVEPVVEEIKEEKPPEVQLPDPVLLIEEARVQAEATRIQAQAEAREAIKQAEAQAQAILSAAKENALRIEEEAREKGYGEGYQKGEAEGAASYEDSIEKAHRAMANIVEEIGGQRESLLAELEEDCLKLAVETANKIIGSVFIQDETAFMTFVRNGIAAIQHDGRVILRVSPDIYEIFFPDGGDSISTEALMIHVIEDDTMQFDDLRIESDTENLDASVRRQTREIEEAFGLAGSET